MKECSKCRRCYNDDVTNCPVDNEPPVFTIAGNTTISGRYILDVRLGQGGMGIVFRAKHKFLKSNHAIKIILPSLVSDDEDLLVRFRQEAILAASIDHPNVIRVTDFGVENDVMPFLVMEYVDGIALSNYLKEGSPLALERAFELFIPAAQGVAEAHRKGIVHRDLKPQNIMVQKNLPPIKAVKVLDFGLAKIKSADSFPSLIQAKTMNIVGSPPYMSPEQWSGEGVDHRTDVYALAVILYQMLTGRLPFQADTMPAMMYQHLTVPPPTAASFGVSISPSIEAVIQKALQKDPQNRFASMDIMLGELGNALASSENKPFTGIATEVMMPSISTGSSIPKPTDTSAPLSDSEKQRFNAYFDSQARSGLVADPKLAHEFLDAQDKIATAKTESINADLLVQELAEAQKEAKAAQDRAIQAKQRIEDDVRRQVEAEMQRLAGADQQKREAEAQRLAQEVEARRVAEERANYLAQAALEAQKLAESERKIRQEEAQQRELQQGVRQEAEAEAKKLAEQVSEAKKQYEDAKNEAAREAQFRAEAENKQKKIEEELQNIALNEAERRKSVEAKAKQFIEEQAAIFEKEAQDAKQRLGEAQSLIELEAQKREKAEAARIEAEQQAERLSQEIVEVQRQMEEMRQSITYEGSSQPGLASVSTRGTGQSQSIISLGSLGSTVIANKKKLLAGGVVGIAAVLIFAIGGIALLVYFLRPAAGPGNTNGAVPPNNSVTPAPKPIERASVLIQGGSFMMGRNDIDDKTDIYFGNQFPAHPETVKSFNIDVYETTNAQYAEFVATGHKAPSYWMNGKPPDREDDFPVTNVSLLDAKAYAEWISAKEKKACRLPTEIEWEYAARNGAQDTTYPWGDDWQEGMAVLDGRAVAVGSSQDVTKVGGVKDMLGNVAEWTTSTYALYKGHPVKQRVDNVYIVRGLSFSATKELFSKKQLLLTFRSGLPEKEDYPYLGFRLVCEP